MGRKYLTKSWQVALEHYKNMPLYASQDLSPIKTLMVNFASEMDELEFWGVIGSRSPRLRTDEGITEDCRQLKVHFRTTANLEKFAEVISQRVAARFGEEEGALIKQIILTEKFFWYPKSPIDNDQPEAAPWLDRKYARPHADDLADATPKSEDRVTPDEKPNGAKRKKRG